MKILEDGPMGRWGGSWQTCHVVMFNWAVLSDEPMSDTWPFSLLNDEQMSNKVRVEHQPVNLFFVCFCFNNAQPSMIFFAEVLLHQLRYP